MERQVKRVAILGSTGSIGRSTLEVIAASEGQLQVVALAARSNTRLLEQQVLAFRPHWAVVTDPMAAKAHDWSSLPSDVELQVGPYALA